MRRREYVYLLLDPRNGTVRYIGLTESRRRRSAEHKRGCACPTNKELCRWERELKSTGRAPTFQVIEMITTYDPHYGNIAGRKAESFWIDYFRRLGAPLFNNT